MPKILKAKTMKQTKPKTNKTKIGKNERCLMIKHNGQQFFTKEKNFPELIEFGRKFNAEIAVVKVNEAEILLDLPSLARCLCDPGYTPSKAEIEVKIIESKLVPIPKDAKPEEDKADIEEYIKDILVKGNKLHISDLYQKWTKDNGNKTNFDYTKVYNKFIKVKQDLISDGWNVTRVDRGVYTAKK